MSRTKNNPHILNNTKKPPIILVHGLRGAPLGLRAIAEELRQNGYDVYVPSVPPFAGAKKLQHYTPEAYADFLATYAQENSLDRPILIGHSMGSIIASAALSLYPNLFHNKAILLSPIPKRPAAFFRIFTPLTVILPRHIIDYIITVYLFIPRNRKLFRETLAITHACSDDRPPTRIETFNATKFSTHYSVSDFPLHRQIFLLAGEKDRLISQKQTLDLAKKLQADVEFIPGCGHIHNYEKPHETTQKILEFLEK